MYDQLRADHHELSAIALELRKRTTRPELDDPGGLGRCRWHLARTLTRHLALEDAHVYARLAQDRRPGAAAISRRYERELGAMRTCFIAHMEDWTGDAIARDWPGYCGAVHAVLDALETRIRCEEDELYPLIYSAAGTLAA